MSARKNVIRAVTIGAVGVAILAPALLSGCSNKAASGNRATPTSTEKRLTEIRLPNTLSELAVLADEKDFFEEEGIKIVWTGQQAHGPANIVSIVAGQNDAGVSINTAIIDAVSKGSKIKIVAPTQKSPLITWLVLDRSPIKGPEDFIGKKVTGASGTIAWFPVTEYLRKKGLDYKKIEFVTLPAPQAEQALRSGQVAVISLSEPFTSKVIAAGGVRKVLDDYQVLGIEEIGGWAFSQDFIDKNPDAVRGFVKGLIKTVAWLKASPENYDEGLRIVLAKGGYSISKDWDDKLLIEKPNIDRWLEILPRYGNIKSGQLKAEDVFTNEFNPNK